MISFDFHFLFSFLVTKIAFGFLIKNFAGNNIFAISQSGVVVLSTQSIQLSNPAPNGGMYFTSGSFFVGLDG